MATQHRGHITKSKAGHYTVTLRRLDGVLVSIHDKLPNLKVARDLLVVLKAELCEVALRDAEAIRRCALAANGAAALDRSTVLPWVVELVSVKPGQAASRHISVHYAPMHRPPIPEDLLPQGARFVRADVFPATRFDDMPIHVRDRYYRAHYRAALMARRAKANGMTVEQLQASEHHDPVLIDEQVERWLRPHNRFVGD